jgi:hypothetical protein
LPGRHRDERSHAGARPARLVSVPDTGTSALRGTSVGQHRDQRRLVRHQRRHIVGIGDDQSKRGDRTAAAREYLDRTSIERLDDCVHVLGLNAW